MKLSDLLLTLIMSFLIAGMLCILIILSMRKATYDKIEKVLKCKNIKNREVSVGYRIIKRFFDIFFGLNGLVLFSPVLFIISVAIKITGSTRIFVFKKCKGYKNIAFKYPGFCLWNENGGYTSFGRVIKKMGLNRYPTLLSLLKGDMTLIGLSVIDINEDIGNYSYLYNYEKPGLIPVGRMFCSLGESIHEVDEMYLHVRCIALDFRIFWYCISRSLTMK